MFKSLSCCNRQDADSKRSSWIIIGVSIVLVLMALQLQLVFGASAYTEALLYSAFPIALIVSGKPGCPGVRGGRALAAIVVMYAAILAVVMLADLI